MATTTAPVVNERDLVERARATLIGATHSHMPLLRSHAIEALAEADQSSGINMILEGLNDEYWGVRFTACMSIMQLKYTPAKTRLIKLVSNDPDRSVQAAAAGALNVLGDTRFTSILGRTLFDKNVIVRRNTTTVLGRMGKPDALRLLRAAMNDEDMSVRLQALEAMTLLGNPKAQRLMIGYCQSVYDDECILAILTIGRAKIEAGGNQVAYVYDRSPVPRRLGMKLVAARTLAMLDDYRGKQVALDALRYRSGPPAQSAGIRNLAAMALGEMADKAALPALRQALNDPDPDVQIAAALAILKIANAHLPL